eukprot:3886742-Rhodomonas_salina.2
MKYNSFPIAENLRFPTQRARMPDKLRNRYAKRLGRVYGVEVLKEIPPEQYETVSVSDMFTWRRRRRPNKVGTVDPEWEEEEDDDDDDRADLKLGYVAAKTNQEKSTTTTPSPSPAPPPSAPRKTPKAPLRQPPTGPSSRPRWRWRAGSRRVCCRRSWSGA